MTGTDAPLRGVRVIDVSRVLAGPMATMLLADLGADVIKVEPPDGDETRGWGPPFWGDPSERRSAYFASVNRGKRSVVIDLKTDAGRDLLDRLAAMADLLIHNFRPGTAERLGLGASRLAQLHPRLIVAAVGGFPGDATAQERPAYDLLAQAASGLMAITGDQHGPPTKVGVAVLDVIAGLELAIGALAALRARDVGARAASVQVSLIEAGVTTLINVLGNHLATGDEPKRHGNAHPNIAPYQAFDAADGPMVVAAGNDAQFQRLLGVLRLKDEAAQFTTNADRIVRRAELASWLGAAIGGRQRDDLLRALDAADVPAGPVQGVGDAVRALDDAHGGQWTTVMDGIRLPPSPIRVGDERLPISRAPPGVGQHTDEVLRELGITSDVIAELRAAKVVA